MLLEKKDFTERGVAELLDKFEKENRHSVWQGLNPSAFRGRVLSEEEENLYLEEKGAINREKVIERIDALEECLRQLKAIADSSQLQHYPELRYRFRGERNFALQLIEKGREFLEEDNKNGGSL
ncbi:MAG: hypothetical protein ACQESA_00145 [Patescibacteria group bacterium]